MVLKNTRIRKAIVQAFQKSRLPLSAADIRAKIPANKTTIYRELYTLTQNNVLTEVIFPDGIKRYESRNLAHHHHLVCLKCSRIDEIIVNEENLTRTVRNFKVTSHNLEFFGFCYKCV